MSTAELSVVLLLFYYGTYTKDIGYARSSKDHQAVT